MEIDEKVKERLKRIDTYTLKELKHHLLIDPVRFQRDLKEISYELERREKSKNS